MGDTVDPATIVLSSGPGVAMCGITRFSDSNQAELTWLLRATSLQIQDAAGGSPVSLRAGFFDQDNICLIPAVICLGAKAAEGNLYETWLNIYQKGENPLLLLAAQNRIVLQFFGDTHSLEHQMQIENPLRGLAETLLRDWERKPAWSLREFEAAKEKLFAQYPDVLSLWQRLGSI